MSEQKRSRRRTTSPRVRLVIVGIVGVLICVVAAAASGNSAAVALELCFITFATAGASLLVATVLSARLNRSLATQLVAITMISTAGVAVGVWIAASQMFVSQHDLGMLLLLLAGGSAASAMAATALGFRVSRSTDLLVAKAASILESDEQHPTQAHSPLHPDEAPSSDRLLSAHMPPEFAEIHSQLEDTQARLIAARTKSQETERGRRALVAWISHDLRTPLAGIRAMSEALADGVVADADTTQEYHHRMVSEVDRLSALVDDLFELSRIDAEAVRLHPSPIAVSDLLSDAISSAQPIAEAKQVTIGGSCPTPSPTVEVSLPEMGRAIRNLVDNAVRHTPPSGSVHLDAQLEGDGVRIDVSDGCGGIPADELANIFEPAFSGDTARTTASDRTGGLGLTIAAGLIAAHGGTLTVANTADGCCFSIHLGLSEK